MKNKKQINVFLKISGVLLLLLSFSLNKFDNKKPSQILKLSSKTEGVVLSNNSQLQFSSINGSINPNYNIPFELNEDDDNDDRNKHCFSSSLNINNGGDSNVISGSFYFKSFVFFEKTPRFILYRNIKAFLS